MLGTGQTLALQGKVGDIGHLLGAAAIVDMDLFSRAAGRPRSTILVNIFSVALESITG